MSRLTDRLDAWYDRQSFEALFAWAMTLFVLCHIIPIAAVLGLKALIGG